MKKILGYLKDYFRNSCDYRYLATLLLFLAAAIYVNYFVVPENVWIKADPRADIRLLKYFGGYLTIFGGAYLIQMIFDRSPQLQSQRLWTLILLGTLMFSLRAWYRPDTTWI